MYTKESTKTYDFGEGILITFRNYRGVCFLGDHTKTKIHSLSVEAASRVNREAWKQANTNIRIANRHCNVSVSGNMSIYEDAASHAQVAQQVAKESYKVMRGFVRSAA